MGTYDEESFGRKRAIKDAPSVPTPLGRRHLHYFDRDRKCWIVVQRKSALCGTPRCRLVVIQPWLVSDDADD